MWFCSHVQKLEHLVQDANISNWFTAQIISFGIKLLSGHLQISQNGESLAKTIKCVAQSNMSFTEENLRLLITEFSRPLQTQIEQSVRIQIKKICVWVLYSKDCLFWKHMFLFAVGNELISEQPHSLVCRTARWKLHVWKSWWCGVHEILVPNQDEASAAQRFERIPVLSPHTQLQLSGLQGSVRSSHSPQLISKNCFFSGYHKPIGLRLII